MKVGGFIVLCGAVQALLIALMVVTPHPAGIDRNPKPMPTVAAVMEGLALNQNLNHLMLQLFDLGHLQQDHDLLDRVTMRHRKTKQAFVVLLEPVSSTHL